MARLGLAFRTFFAILGDAAFADRVTGLTDAAAPTPPRQAEPRQPDPAIVPTVKTTLIMPPAPPPSARSDALTLLAMLQQQGRFVDFLKESITGFSDAQVGGAVREVHRGCNEVLERYLAIRSVRQEAEGASLTIPAGNDGTEIRLTGNVAGQPPYSGRLTHAGWQATKVELPQWTGTAAGAKVIAPAEVEVG